MVLMRGLPAGRARSPQPSKPDGDHTGIESVVGLLDSVVGHVHIAVFKNEGPLRIEEILNAQASLRVELRVAGEFGRPIINGGVEHAGPEIEKRNDLMPGLAVQAEKQRVADGVPARMERAAQNTFADHAESADWETAGVKILDRKPHARLGNQNADMRYVVRNIVFNRKANLQAESQPPAVCPVIGLVRRLGHLGCRLGLGRLLRLQCSGRNQKTPGQQNPQGKDPAALKLVMNSYVWFLGGRGT